MTIPQPYAVVIEDDPQLSLIYQTTLQHAGFNTALDTNGDKYETLLAAAEPALVILDLHLPFVLGSEILNYIRAKYPKTVVAVVTADLVQAKSLTDKADYVLIKPVSVGRLIKIIESIKG